MVGAFGHIVAKGSTQVEPRILILHEVHRAMNLLHPLGNFIDL